MANCCKCNVELTDDNWIPSWKKNNTRKCRACLKAYDAINNPRKNAGTMTDI